MNYKTIQNNLRECRNRVNLKQIDVAHALGFKSEARISRWENGTAYPHALNLLKLAKIYSVKAEELYSEELVSSSN